MKRLLFHKMGMSFVCLLFVFSCVARAQTFAVGENAVVGFGGCEATRDNAAGSPVTGSLDPKQWVTVQESVGDRIKIQIDTEERSLEGWVPASCLISTEAFFADPVCAGESWMERKFALDEAHPEAVARMVKTGSHYVLKIFDAQGNLLWNSPEETSEDPDAALDQLTFFCGAEEDYWPRFLGDLNGDNKAELFMPARHSSVDGPLPLYLYVWDGKTFNDASKARCLVERKRDSGLYEWVEFFDEVPDGTRWLLSPVGMEKDGTSEWEVFEMSGDSVLSGRAVFRVPPNLETAVLVRWTKPLSE